MKMSWYSILFDTENDVPIIVDGLLHFLSQAAQSRYHYNYISSNTQYSKLFPRDRGGGKGHAHGRMMLYPSQFRVGSQQAIL